ncbi:MAG: DedA family protein [Candidatus Pacebacteria bacterium]|nr:DedA family protein [Candidatus Paceibacterota bacterium]
MDFFASLQAILAPLSLHPYVFIFIGLFFFGETVFFPALYLAFRGTLEVHVVIVLMIGATLLSDLVWYAIGRSLPRTTAVRLMGGRAAHVMESISLFFSTHRLSTLYISKFVYGTRTVVQVMSGMYKTPFWKYMLVNILGTTSLAAFILILAYITSSTLVALTDTVHALEIGFLILIVLIAAVHFFIRHAIARQWFRS